MPLQSAKNEYAGINAHLHSSFQVRGGWASFHSQHISFLAGALNAALPAGYIVDIEQSLQVHEFHPDTGERVRLPRPDLTVFQTASSSPKATPSPTGAAPTATLPLVDTVERDEDLYYRALVVYQQTDDDPFGIPVTRIEVLSPSNKSGHGALQYREKRLLTFRTGLALVELDYLHMTPPVLRHVPVYPHDPGATAYMIVVSTPKPSLEQGTAQIYGVHADAPLPVIALPLAGDDHVTVDFAAVYEQTFASLDAYALRVDYAVPPLALESYSETDQARIRARMQAVADAQT